MGEITCSFGCAAGHFVASRTDGMCSADGGATTASYSGQSITCTQCEAIEHCGGQVTCSSLNDEICAACEAGWAGQQCQARGRSPAHNLLWMFTYASCLTS